MAATAVLGTIELLEHVLSFLSFYDLHRAQLVSQTWKNTIHHSLTLQRNSFNERIKESKNEQYYRWGDYISKSYLLNPVLQRTLLVPRDRPLIHESSLQPLRDTPKASEESLVENPLETEPDPEIPIVLQLKDGEQRPIWEYSWNTDDDIPFEEVNEYKLGTKWKKSLLSQPPLYEALVRPKKGSDDSWVFREEEGLKMEQLLWSISQLDVLEQDTETGALRCEVGTEMVFEILIPLRDPSGEGNAKSGVFNLLRPCKTELRIRIV